MNNITVFKENDKLYIVLTNPSQEVEKQIMDVLGNTAVNIAEILKPEEENDTLEEAARIEEAAASEQKKQKNDSATVANNTSACNSQKSVDVTTFTPDKAKRYLTRFLMALEKNPDTKFYPKNVLIAYFKARNREDGVRQVVQMSDEEASNTWLEKAMLKKVVRVTGYDFHAPEGIGYDGWV